MTTVECDYATKPVDLASAPEFDLGPIRVRPAERLVEGGGVRTELQPRVMQVLVALSDARPRVVSRDKLIERCWNGRVVGDDALNRCILALRHLAKSCSPEPFVIETVPRVGHRLVEREVGPASGPTARTRVRVITAVILSLVLLTGIIVAALWWRSPGSEPATIAVLPFRSLSTGDPYFAEGIGEEILNRLAEEPEFSVAGRTSTAQYRNAADLREVGRALGVDYVLEGSVRAEPGRVRVNASLVKTHDGMRMWSQSYDRKLGDIFDIQQAIGSSVADALSRRLLPNAAPNQAMTENAETYRSYLAARGMLRTRNPQLGESAITLLRQAVAADPNYAPAWASLAQAIRLKAALDGQEAAIAILPEAQSNARRAVALAPRLAEGHGVLGMLLGYRSQEAQAHLRRAGALEPRNVDAQLWLATAERLAGNYDGEIAAYRRAVSLDPHWFRPNRDLAIALAEMGDRGAGDSIADHGVFDAANRNALTARIAWLYGDFARAAETWAKGAHTDSIWQAPARVALENARYTLSLPGAKPPRRPVPVAELRPNVGRFWMATAPPPEVWRQRNRSEAAALVYDDENLIAAKLMLNAGRGRELLWGYNGQVGLLGIHRNLPIEAAHLANVPYVALALRQGGRRTEADQLLIQAQSRVDAIFRAGKTPFTFDVDAAAIAAVAGNAGRAIAELEKAQRRGWSHSDPDDLVKLTDEPAFAALHDDPRFKIIVARLDAQIARERQKAIALGL